MSETFPTTPRTPRAVRLCAIAIGLVALALTVRVTATSVAWVGRVFPGFVLVGNGMVPTIALTHWSGRTVPDLYWSQVVAVQGEPVTSAREVYAKIASVSPGIKVRYRLRRAGSEREVSVQTQRFTWRDWFLLFGAALANAAVFVAAGLVVWVLRPQAAVARAFLAVGTVGGFYMITFADAYGPSTFWRLNVVGDALLPATFLQLALLFPQPKARAGWHFAGYAVSIPVALFYNLFFFANPPMFTAVVYFNYLFLGFAIVFFAARVASTVRRGSSALARQQTRIVVIGALLGVAVPAAVLLGSGVTGGRIATNGAFTTPFVCVLSVAYAIVKHDLFEIDAMVKRGAYYLLLTGAVGAAYMGAVVLFNWILQAGAVTTSPAFPILFTLAVLLAFNPLRTRLQGFVDRVFFRTRYDAARVLATVGGELASALQREQITTLVCAAVQGALPNACTRVFIAGAEGGLRASNTEVPTAVARALTSGRVVTAFDPAERYPNAAVRDTVRAGLAAINAEIAVPLLHGHELRGVLTAGPKHSGLFYTAGDAEFLRALAHQAATALENARSYEALVDLNARLEERVHARTAQLEAANRDLADAYSELKTAEVQLVQSEKMASLGRLVAGVAHEINNPVSFIASNVAPLRRRLAAAALAAPPAAQPLLREAQEIADVMARGAERTAAIVADLRSFSRLGETTRQRADLRDGIEVTLRLLESRWRGCITIHRDYGSLPPVEGDPGQLNQVFMNVLANACDAISGSGNIWITMRAVDTGIMILVRDDGTGMPPEVVARIFEPFFTTKDVGAGTGLGLALSHGVVSAHGGQIDVESVPGQGTTFRIVLPAAAAPPRAANGTS